MMEMEQIRHGRDISRPDAPYGYSACSQGLWILVASMQPMPDALTVAEYSAMSDMERFQLHMWVINRTIHHQRRLPLPRLLHTALPERYVRCLTSEVA